MNDNGLLGMMSSPAPENTAAPVPSTPCGGCSIVDSSVHHSVLKVTTPRGEELLDLGMLCGGCEKRHINRLKSNPSYLNDLKASLAGPAPTAATSMVPPGNEQPLPADTIVPTPAQQPMNAFDIASMARAGIDDEGGEEYEDVEGEDDGQLKQAANALAEVVSNTPQIPRVVTAVGRIPDDILQQMAMPEELQEIAAEMQATPTGRIPSTPAKQQLPPRVESKPNIDVYGFDDDTGRGVIFGQIHWFQVVYQCFLVPAAIGANGLVTRFSMFIPSTGGMYLMEPNDKEWRFLDKGDTECLLPMQVIDQLGSTFNPPLIRDADTKTVQDGAVKQLVTALKRLNESITITVFLPTGAENY